MCGQLGIIFGTKRRRQEEIDHLTDIFTDLLLLSEKRGPHATGIAWLNRDGEHGLYKQPVPAQEFVEDRRYRRVISGVGNKTTILMGHTRWQTRGDAQNNLNNHPIKTKFTVGTHNGTISNADRLFRQYKLPRVAEVDSEVIFRIADSVLCQSNIDTNRLAAKLSFCRGQMSAVMASKTDPGTIIAIKGNKPLELRYHKRYRALMYASEGEFLDMVLSDPAWVDIPVEPLSMLIIPCNDLLGLTLRPMDFCATPRLLSKQQSSLVDTWR